MDARAHFDSYRESLKKGALDGCVEYSRAVKTANPQRYPTVYDYLKYTLDAAKYHAENDDPTSYMLWLPKHQEAMILLFERMVSEIMFDAAEITADMLLALIDEKGLNWFKFNPKSLVYHITLDNGEKLKINLIPSCSKLGRFSLTDGAAVLDADELGSLLAYRDTTLAREVADHKKSNPNVKFLGTSLLDRKTVPHYRPIASVNAERVWDWALPLFGGLNEKRK